MDYINTKRNRYAKVAMPVIRDAVEGNPIAINNIISNYDSYMTRLAVQIGLDEGGNCHMVVDDELYNRLKTKLITKILDFKIA